MTVSISRQFARWASDLTYEDLPPEVLDKLKANILFHLVSGVMGASMPRAEEITAMVKAEEHRPDGATILIDGAKATRSGATLANCEILYCSGLNDSFRMLTHPGPVLVAVALTNAELGKNTFKEMITALAAGYEFERRLAYDFTPTVAAHGFRPSPVFATMGAAMVAGKLLALDEDRLVAAIAVAASSASGLMEPMCAHGTESAIDHAIAARHGVAAAMMASAVTIKGSETANEGEAGFYAAFAGSRDGKLSYVFTGPRHIELSSITENLGEHYRLMEVMFRMYERQGYNQLVIALMVELMRDHKILIDDISEVVISMNYIEVLRPSPEFAKPMEHSEPRVGSTPYVAAYVAVNGDYPVVGGKPFRSEEDLDNERRVLTFMKEHVRLIGVHEQPMFSPKISIAMKNGDAYFGEYPYARMEWNFDEVADHLHDCVPGLPGGQHRLDLLIEAVRDADELASVEPLFRAAGTP